MTSSTPFCNRDQLYRLLFDDLSSEEHDATARHLDSCESCCAELESLAANREVWKEAKLQLASIAFEIGRSRHAARCTTESACHATSKRTDLGGDDRTAIPADFLAKSDNPAMLGRLGEYEILEVIGHGGMGIVFKGYDHELNRFVAVKTLAPHLARNSSARKRFTRESQAAAAVVHPHVVPIHSVDANTHAPYFVMAYVPGESLQERIDRVGSLPLEQILRIATQIAEGLSAAHAQGLVHRDVKPANILLERNVDRVLLTDFGLARAADDASMTQSGTIVGTPHYMSPEQASGEAVDLRTDQFSLGSVMYAMCTGHPPFRAEGTFGLLHRIVHATPRSVRELNSEIPIWLERLITRLLAKTPQDRWSSLSEVAGILRSCLAHMQQPLVERLPRELAEVPTQKSLRTEFIIFGLAAIGISIGLGVNHWYGTFASPKTQTNSGKGEIRRMSVGAKDSDSPSWTITKFEAYPLFGVFDDLRHLANPPDEGDGSEVNPFRSLENAPHPPVAPAPPPPPESPGPQRGPTIEYTGLGSAILWFKSLFYSASTKPDNP